MIRREDGQDWLLISQIDHAHLSGELASLWDGSVIAPLPLPELLIPAIRDHDEGWREWEKAPQIDPQANQPRNFTEMPMAVSTTIWSRSIEFCQRGIWSHARAVQRLQAYLDIHNQTFTREIAAVLDTLLQFRSSFTPEELNAALLRKLETQEIPHSAVNQALYDLQEAGILQPLPDDQTPPFSPAYQVTLPAGKSSPLGGLWVARHFCDLAQKAYENRHDAPEEQDVLQDFLDRYDYSLNDLPTDVEAVGRQQDLPGLIERGFRSVQFFDHISLWLCCALRNEPYEMEAPGGQKFRLVPRDAQNLTAVPFPFLIEQPEFKVPARRIPARTYTDDADLQTELAQAPWEELCWTFHRK